MSNQMMSPPMTPEAIKCLLDRDNYAVERAVLAIYARQTGDEQASETTKHHNCRGFSAFDAGLGSYYARWLQSGRHLSGPHLERARRMMKRYANQLAEVAAAKAAAAQQPTLVTAA